MFKITVSTELAVPAATALEYISDFANNPAWQSGVASTEWTSEPPLRVGSTYDQQMEYKDLVTSYVVVAIDPGRAITTESEAGATIPTRVTRTVRLLNETRCRITVDLVGEPRGLRRLTKPLLTRLIRRSVAADYQRLRRLLESEPDQS